MLKSPVKCKLFLPNTCNKCNEKKPQRNEKNTKKQPRSNSLDTSDNKHCDYDVNVPISDIGWCYMHLYIIYYHYLHIQLYHINKYILILLKMIFIRNIFQTLISILNIRIKSILKNGINLLGFPVFFTWKLLPKNKNNEDTNNNTVIFIMLIS